MWATNTPHASSLILKMYLVTMVTASPYQRCRKKLNWTAGTLITQVFFYTVPGERLAGFHLEQPLLSVYTYCCRLTTHHTQQSVRFPTPLFHKRALLWCPFHYIYAIFTLAPRHWRKRQLQTPHRPVDQVSPVTQESDLNVQDRSVTLGHSALREPFDSNKN